MLSYAALAKTKTSSRTNELPTIAEAALRWHLRTFPVRAEWIEDETDPRKIIQRPAQLVFTRGDGRPIHRADWSHIWRPAVAVAGLPEGYGLRDLRHYFATVLIFGGANVKTVQLAMGHTTPTVTLNTRPDPNPRRVRTGLYPGCTRQGAGRESAGQGLCVTCSS
jgi:integrase